MKKWYQLKILPSIVISVLIIFFSTLFNLTSGPLLAEGLPIRPTITPNLINNQSEGGFIRLKLAPTERDVWTVIEWKNSEGDWELTDGWRGSPNEKNEVLWYVGPDDLGAYWYRWLIYDSLNGELLKASAPFILPSHAGGFVEIDFSSIE